MLLNHGKEKNLFSNNQGKYKMNKPKLWQYQYLGSESEMELN